MSGVMKKEYRFFLFLLLNTGLLQAFDWSKTITAGWEATKNNLYSFTLKHPTMVKVGCLTSMSIITYYLIKYCSRYVKEKSESCSKKHEQIAENSGEGIPVNLNEKPNALTPCIDPSTCTTCDQKEILAKVYKSYDELTILTKKFYNSLSMRLELLNVESSFIRDLQIDSTNYKQQFSKKCNEVILLMKKLPCSTCRVYFYSVLQAIVEARGDSLKPLGVVVSKKFSTIDPEFIEQKHGLTKFFAFKIDELIDLRSPEKNFASANLK